MQQRATLTQQQEAFILDFFDGVKPGRAYLTHYKCKSLSVADACASRLLKSAKIQGRLAELRAKAENATVMGVLERKQVLSEIARTNVTDFMEMGQDGTWVNIGKETPHTVAIAELHSRTEYDDNGAHPTVHTSVKLIDKTKAIDLLNKLDRLYSETPPQVNDNRQYNIIVADELTREMTRRILSGERRQEIDVQRQGRAEEGE